MYLTSFFRGWQKQKKKATYTVFVEGKKTLGPTTFSHGSHFEEEFVTDLDLRRYESLTQIKESEIYSNRMLLDLQDHGNFTLSFKYL